MKKIAVCICAAAAVISASSVRVYALSEEDISAKAAVDSSWGHRRDVAGYAAGLELFDRRLPELMSLLRDDDILILTADHGCDPTWTGTDHTREHIPVLVYGPKVKPGSLGHRETFADIGQTLAKYFGTSDMEYGKAMF